MQAIVLAAGMGKRLGKYTQDSTKCMVKVNGKTLIERTIESLCANNIEKLVIVTGYKAEKLKSFIDSTFNSKSLNGMSIEYIENPIYDKTNNIYSLYLAKDVLLRDDTLLLESDIVYNPDLITNLINAKDKNLTVLSPFESWMDGTCAILDKENKIVGIVDKKTFNWNNTPDYYKTVNIYKFSKEFSQKYYVPFLEAHIKAFGQNEYYEQVIKTISYYSMADLDEGGLKGFVISSDSWYEIDDYADLVNANIKFSSTDDQFSLLQKTYGGYWRFPYLKDYCYLVNPYFPPTNMLDEIKANFQTLLTNYPSGDKVQSILCSKIFQVDEENIVIGNGAAELIRFAMQDIKENVAVCYPTFNEYPECLKNAKIVPLLLKKENGFRYSVNDIVDCVRKNKCSYALLINPDNPSGNFLKQKEVIELLDKLNKLNCTLIFDESFIDFADKDIRYTLICQDILNKYENLIVIKSISKSHGVPGLRLGVLASGDKNMISKLKTVHPIWNINSFAEFYLQIFDKYKKSYISACDKIANERARFYKDLQTLNNLEVFESQSNFFLLRFKKPIAREVSINLLSKCNIFIKDLTGKTCFDTGDFVRIAIKEKKDNQLLFEELKITILESN